jgi:hypothetical protein
MVRSYLHTSSIYGLAMHLRGVWGGAATPLEGLAGAVAALARAFLGDWPAGLVLLAVAAVLASLHMAILELTQAEAYRRSLLLGALSPVAAQLGLQRGPCGCGRTRAADGGAGDLGADGNNDNDGPNGGLGRLRFDVRVQFGDQFGNQFGDRVNAAAAGARGWFGAEEAEEEEEDDQAAHRRVRFGVDADGVFRRRRQRGRRRRRQRDDQADADQAEDQADADQADADQAEAAIDNPEAQAQPQAAAAAAAALPDAFVRALQRQPGRRSLFLRAVDALSWVRRSFFVALLRPVAPAWRATVGYAVFFLLMYLGQACMALLLAPPDAALVSSPLREAHLGRPRSAMGASAYMFKVPLDSLSRAAATVAHWGGAVLGLDLSPPPEQPSPLSSAVLQQPAFSPFFADEVFLFENQTYSIPDTLRYHVHPTSGVTMLQCIFFLPFIVGYLFALRHHHAKNTALVRDMLLQQGIGRLAPADQDRVRFAATVDVLRQTLLAGGALNRIVAAILVFRVLFTPALMRSLMPLVFSMLDAWVPVRILLREPRRVVLAFLRGSGVQVLNATAAAAAPAVGADSTGAADAVGGFPVASVDDEDFLEALEHAGDSFLFDATQGMSAMRQSHRGLPPADPAYVFESLFWLPLTVLGPVLLLPRLLLPTTDPAALLRRHLLQLDRQQEGDQAPAAAPAAPLAAVPEAGAPQVAAAVPLRPAVQAAGAAAGGRDLDEDDSDAEPLAEDEAGENPQAGAAAPQDAPLPGGAAPFPPAPRVQPPRANAAARRGGARAQVPVGAAPLPPHLARQQIQIAGPALVGAAMDAVAELVDIREAARVPAIGADGEEGFPFHEALGLQGDMLAMLSFFVKSCFVVFSFVSILVVVPMWVGRGSQSVGLGADSMSLVLHSRLFATDARGPAAVGVPFTELMRLGLASIKDDLLFVVDGYGIIFSVFMLSFAINALARRVLLLWVQIVRLMLIFRLHVLEDLVGFLWPDVLLVAYRALPESLLRGPFELWPAGVHVVLSGKLMLVLGMKVLVRPMVVGIVLAFSMSIPNVGTAVSNAFFAYNQQRVEFFLVSWLMGLAATFMVGSLVTSLREGLAWKALARFTAGGDHLRKVMFELTATQHTINTIMSAVIILTILGSVITVPAALRAFHGYVRTPAAAPILFDGSSLNEPAPPIRSVALLDLAGPGYKLFEGRFAKGTISVISLTCVDMPSAAHSSGSDDRAATELWMSHLNITRPSCPRGKVLASRLFVHSALGDGFSVRKVFTKVSFGEGKLFPFRAFGADIDSGTDADDDEQGDMDDAGDDRASTIVIDGGLAQNSTVMDVDGEGESKDTGATRREGKTPASVKSESNGGNIDWVTEDEAIYRPSDESPYFNTTIFEGTREWEVLSPFFYKSLALQWLMQGNDAQHHRPLAQPVCALVGNASIPYSLEAADYIVNCASQEGGELLFRKIPVLSFVAISGTSGQDRLFLRRGSAQGGPSASVPLHVFYAQYNGYTSLHTKVANATADMHAYEVISGSSFSPSDADISSVSLWMHPASSVTENGNNSVPGSKRQEGRWVAPSGFANIGTTLPHMARPSSMPGAADKTGPEPTPMPLLRVGSLVKLGAGNFQRVCRQTEESARDFLRKRYHEEVAEGHGKSGPGAPEATEKEGAFEPDTANTATKADPEVGAADSNATSSIVPSRTFRSFHINPTSGLLIDCGPTEAPATTLATQLPPPDSILLWSAFSPLSFNRYSKATFDTRKALAKALLLSTPAFIANAPRATIGVVDGSIVNLPNADSLVFRMLMPVTVDRLVNDMKHVGERARVLAAKFGKFSAGIFTVAFNATFDPGSQYTPEPTLFVLGWVFLLGVVATFTFSVGFAPIIVSQAVLGIFRVVAGSWIVAPKETLLYETHVVDTTNDDANILLYPRTARMCASVHRHVDLSPGVGLSEKHLRRNLLREQRLQRLGQMTQALVDRSRLLTEAASDRIPANFSNAYPWPKKVLRVSRYRRRNVMKTLLAVSRRLGRAYFDPAGYGNALEQAPLNPTLTPAEQWCEAAEALVRRLIAGDFLDLCREENVPQPDTGAGANETSRQHRLSRLARLLTAFETSFAESRVRIRWVDERTLGAARARRFLSQFTRAAWPQQHRSRVLAEPSPDEIPGSYHVKEEWKASVNTTLEVDAIACSDVLDGDEEARPAAPAAAAHAGGLVGPAGDDVDEEDVARVGILPALDAKVEEANADAIEDGFCPNAAHEAFVAKRRQETIQSSKTPVVMEGWIRPVTVAYGLGGRQPPVFLGSGEAQEAAKARLAEKAIRAQLSKKSEIPVVSLHMDDLTRELQELAMLDFLFTLPADTVRSLRTRYGWYADEIERFDDADDIIRWCTEEDTASAGANACEELTAALEETADAFEKKLRLSEKKAILEKLASAVTAVSTSGNGQLSATLASSMVHSYRELQRRSRRPLTGRALEEDSKYIDDRNSSIRAAANRALRGIVNDSDRCLHMAFPAAFQAALKTLASRSEGNRHRPKFKKVLKPLQFRDRTLPIIGYLLPSGIHREINTSTLDEILGYAWTKRHTLTTLLDTHKITLLPSILLRTCAHCGATEDDTGPTQFVRASDGVVVCSSGRCINEVSVRKQAASQVDILKKEVIPVLVKVLPQAHNRSSQKSEKPDASRKLFVLGRLVGAIGIVRFVRLIAGILIVWLGLSTIVHFILGFSAATTDSASSIVMVAVPGFLSFLLAPGLVEYVFSALVTGLSVLSLRVGKAALLLGLQISEAWKENPAGRVAYLAVPRNRMACFQKGQSVSIVDLLLNVAAPAAHLGFLGRISSRISRRLKRTTLYCLLGLRRFSSRFRAGEDYFVGRETFSMKRFSGIFAVALLYSVALPLVAGFLLDWSPLQVFQSAPLGIPPYYEAMLPSSKMTANRLFFGFSNMAASTNSSDAGLPVMTANSLPCVVRDLRVEPYILEQLDQLGSLQSVNPSEFAMHQQSVWTMLSVLAGSSAACRIARDPVSDQLTMTVTTLSWIQRWSLGSSVMAILITLYSFISRTSIIDYYFCLESSLTARQWTRTIRNLAWTGCKHLVVYVLASFSILAGGVYYLSSSFLTWADNADRVYLPAETNTRQLPLSFVMIQNQPTNSTGEHDTSLIDIQYMVAISLNTTLACILLSMIIFSANDTGLTNSIQSIFTGWREELRRERYAIGKTLRDISLSDRAAAKSFLRAGRTVRRAH